MYTISEGNNSEGEIHYYFKDTSFFTLEYTISFVRGGRFEHAKRLYTAIMS